MGIVCADFDEDGDTDIFVGNDVAGNSIFQNDGRGVFEEVGLVSGLAYDLTGRAQGTMGVACGDFNNDGRLDFYVTSYQRDLATLYANGGGGIFQDVTRSTGAGDQTFAQVTWGNGMVDFDNDGDLDLFVACGHLHDNVALFDRTTSYRARNILLENEQGQRFINVSDRAGSGLQVRRSSRGAAFDDLDNDGDIDVVILNSRSAPTLLRNVSENQNHWIQVRLRGKAANRDGIGARGKVRAGDLFQVAGVHSRRGCRAREMPAGVGGDRRGQRGRARAGRAVEQDRRAHVRLQHPPEELARAQDVPLTAKLVQGSRPHACSERLDRSQGPLAVFSPEIGHGAILPHEMADTREEELRDR